MINKQIIVKSKEKEEMKPGQSFSGSTLLGPLGALCAVLFLQNIISESERERGERERREKRERERERERNHKSNTLGVAFTDTSRTSQYLTFLTVGQNNLVLSCVDGVVYSKAVASLHSSFVFVLWFVGCCCL